MRCWFSPIVRHSVVLTALIALPLGATHAADSPVDFNHDIRPILSNRCWKCHGPDEKERQAGLRLDAKDGLSAKLESGKVAVVAGKPEESELIRRIVSDDNDVRMPPSGHGKKLDPKEIELLRAWIMQGARFAKHWSYEVPVRPAVPDVSDLKSQISNLKFELRNPIDNFIVSRL